MRYGHGSNGIVGITLKPRALKKWALSMHTCSQLVQDVADMEEGKAEVEVTRHKEEGLSRIASDARVRRKNIDKPQSCIDPFSPGDDPDEIVNIVPGRVATNNVNVDKSVDVGLSQDPMIHNQGVWRQWQQRETW